jgi:hypothetical protein
MESLGGTGYVNSTARGGILTSEQVNTLKETAKRTMRVREGCLNGRHARDDDSVVQAEFHAAFDPTTCLELLEEVERLREVERESQALDRLTDRVLKFDITEALKP